MNESPLVAFLLPQHEWLSLTIYVAVAAWVLAVGACVGSFLNVLIYRLPLGLNIAYPGSRCPKCGAAIAGKDNIPVISWLLLRGRCRRCRAPISSRYPLFESITAIAFFVLAAIELFTRGANLPVSGWYSSFAPELWGVYGLQLLLLSLLIASAGMAYDGQEMPIRLPALAIGAALAITTACPGLRPVAASFTHAGEYAAAWTLRLGEGLTGAFLGGLLGAFAFPLALRRSKGRTCWILPEAIWSLALAGVICGWQATPVLAVAASVLFLAGSLGGRAMARLASWPACLAIAFIAFLTGWRTIDRSSELTRRADWPLLAASAAAVTGLSFAAAFLRRAFLTPTEDENTAGAFVFLTDEGIPAEETPEQAWRIIVEAGPLSPGETSSGELNSTNESAPPRLNNEPHT